MVYKKEVATTARIFKTTKPIIRKVIDLLEKESRGRISEAVAIDESVKLYLKKRGLK